MTWKKHEWKCYIDINVLVCAHFYINWERKYKRVKMYCVWQRACQAQISGQSESVLIEEIFYTPVHTHTNTVFSRPYNPVTAPYSTLRDKSKAAVSLQQRFVCLIVHKHVHKYTYTQPRLTDKTVLQAILEPWWKYKTLSKNMPQPLDMLILYYMHNVDRKGKATLLEDQCVSSIPSLHQLTHTLNYCSEQAVMVYN